ncbi:alpha/beta fold hydrolase [Agromyces sp. CFH 90414]|uniref:Alpha/beta fold hydrolase n=1 Tax=Agromyces agglutinans TaxID=2662258 RepID=A0A6I2F928_9MICO|nr:alpha/beta hydrolase [Agromyces agglutinans]MRG60277.1 alpha/beta fold hydrolase [Agromyces agglutinans]
MSEFATTPSGDRIAYDRRGSGPGLVFVAGAGPFRAIDPWTTQTAELMADSGVTTIVYDRLGRGESPAEGRLDLDRELETLATLIDVAGGSAVLCGHSSGCSISLAAAARGLDVAGLVLWEPPFGAIDGGAREWAGEVERRIDAGDLEGALAHYMKDMPPEWLEGLRQSPEYPQFVSQVVSYVGDGESLAWVESAPLDALLRDVRVPLEVLLGQETFPELFDAAERIVAAVPGSRWLQIPGADHTWEPAAMAAELTRFVTAAATERVR